MQCVYSIPIIMTRNRIRFFVNILIATLVPAAWLLMSFGREAVLSENGIGNLRYFTVLSNIMEGLASLVWLAAMSGGDNTSDDNGIDDDKIKRAERFKYIAAAAVMLTFATVVGFFGPLYGYGMMFDGANLYFHLIIPVIAAAEFVFLSDGEFTVKDNNLVVIPPLVYGIVYLINVLINGRENGDWYWFLAWGYPAGILIFACICLATWLLAFIMRKLQRSIRIKLHNDF